MKTTIALWRRELRAHAVPIVGLVLVGAGVDVLQLAQSAAVGDVSPYERPLNTLLPFVVIVAAILPSRVFVGEAQRGTWPWLFALPVTPMRVMLAKLSFVIVGTVGLVWCRLLVHTLLGAPTPWWELFIRVLVRCTAVAALLATTLSAGAVLGRRAVLPGLAILIVLSHLGDLLGISLMKEGPLGLVNAATAGVDDRGWPLAPLGVALLISMAGAAVVIVAGLAGRVTDWLARPWSRPALLGLAAALGVLLAINVTPIRRATEPIPADVQAAPGRAVVLPSSTAADTADLQGVRDACQRALDLVAGAVPEARLPRVVIVRRDDLKEPLARFLDDNTLQLATAAGAAPAAGASALVSTLLWRGRGSADDATVGFVLVGLPRAIGHLVAGAPGPRQMVLRRATCDDARRWRAFRERDGSQAAAGAFFVDLVGAYGEPALLESIAALWRGENDVTAILEAGAAVCARPLPVVDVPWLGVGPGLAATFEVRQLSALTVAPFIQLPPSAAEGATGARVWIWQRSFLNAGQRELLVETGLPVSSLVEGVYPGVAVAPDTPLEVAVTLEVERDGERQFIGTGVIPLGGR